MIGIVIVTHCGLGNSLIHTAEFILGSKVESVVSVSVDIRDDAEKLRKKIEKEIKGVDAGKGVLILTDMFGGTPSNLSYSFLKDECVEVISGVNLPILIKAINSRKKMGLEKIATTLVEYGKRSISLASGILKGNKRS